MFNQVFWEREGKRITQWLFIVLVFLSVFLLAKSIGELKKLPNIGKEIYPQSSIQVSGSGEAYAIPDVATFSFSVVETGGTVEQAQEKSDTKINKVLSAIRESGVEEKDINTTNYSVYPKYEYNQPVCITYPCPSGKQVLTGYEVNQTITVKVRDTEKAGDLVTKVGAAGVSNISGIEFAVDDREQYVDEARKQAIAEAKEKAKILADQLDVRLGKMMYYNENGQYPYYGEAMGLGGGKDMAVSQAAPVRAELPIGETKITSNVTITYEIR